jgi:hypothetical protein
VFTLAPFVHIQSARIASLASAEYSAVALESLISARHSGGITEYVSAFTLPDMLVAFLCQLPR